ncbi:hypothetical protein GCM10007301_49770 [Azorhizobium oxalatiphilum]|uniref:Uncharacterized protein n=1 Tax=Azorhizobium oxalatiphilum TaxID=980631 RepID=A0A917CE84_9HYPH|nr:hypothetical protein [Azorhizobium oxalatiphilum]GGF83818.1 hypothetical protein GCM10007301_49770 [Azorhizobium oxalatiphilum]
MRTGEGAPAAPGPFDPDAYRAGLRGELFWMAADQTVAFDDILRMPIRDRPAFQDRVLAYLQTIHALAPEAPLSRVEDAFDGLLADLRRAGEDTDRLLLWLGAQEDYPGEDRLGVGALAAWRDAFWRWTAGTAALPRELVPVALLETYRAEVAAPREALFVRSREARGRFLSCPESRSSRDNLLWGIYFSGVETDPTTLFRPLVDNRLHRQWWRRHRLSLTPPARAALFDALVETIQRHGDPQVQDWSCVQPIDDALRVDDIPDFDRYARAAQDVRSAGPSIP